MATAVTVSNDGRVCHVTTHACEPFPAEPSLLHARLRYAEKMREQLLSQVAPKARNDQGQGAETGGEGVATAAAAAAKFEPFTQQHLDALKAAADRALATASDTGVKTIEQFEYERVQHALKALPVLNQQFSGWAMFDHTCNHLAVLADSVPLFLVDNYPWVRRMVHEPSFRLMNNNNPVCENINLLTALDNFLEPIPVYMPLLFALLHGGKPHELCLVPLYVSSLTLYRFYCNARMWLMEQDDADLVAKQVDEAHKHELAERGDYETLAKEQAADDKRFDEQRRANVLRTVNDAREAVKRTAQTISARLRLMYNQKLDAALNAAQEQADIAADTAGKPRRQMMPFDQAASVGSSKHGAKSAAHHTVQVLRTLEAQIITLLRLPGTCITALATPPKTLPPTCDVDAETLEDCNNGRLYMLNVLQQVVCRRGDESMRLTKSELRSSPFADVNIGNETSLLQAHAYMRACHKQREAVKAKAKAKDAPSEAEPVVVVVGADKDKDKDTA